MTIQFCGPMPVRKDGTPPSFDEIMAYRKQPTTWAAPEPVALTFRSGGAATTRGTPATDELNRVARELKARSRGMTMAQALRRAMEDDPTLAAQVRAEENFRPGKLPTVEPATREILRSAAPPSAALTALAKAAADRQDVAIVAKARELSVWSEIEKLGDAERRHNPRLTVAQARVQAMRLNPDVKKRLDAARMTRLTKMSQTEL